MKNIILMTLFCISAFANNNMKIYTEHYPPYNMKSKEGKLVKSSIEVLEAVLKQMDSKQSVKDVKLRSWAKSYAVAQKINNARVFSTTKTKSKEPLFKWVGPIALKSKKILITKASDFNKYKIGAVLKDIGEILLLDAGVDKKNIHHIKGEDAINLSFNKIIQKWQNTLDIIKKMVLMTKFIVIKEIL